MDGVDDPNSESEDGGVGGSIDHILEGGDGRILADPPRREDVRDLVPDEGSECNVEYPESLSEIELEIDECDEGDWVTLPEFELESETGGVR